MVQQTRRRLKRGHGQGGGRMAATQRRPSVLDGGPLARSCVIQPPLCAEHIVLIPPSTTTPCALGWNASTGAAAGAFARA
eukprot:m.367180 g.367180  ORF g.367180 m.367180 type:complete len:80 (-) comp20825_c0_seq1:2188-2427(-)